MDTIIILANNGNSFAILTLAILYYKKNQINKAEAMFLKIPNEGEANYFLYLIYFIKNKKLSINYLEKSIDLNYTKSFRILYELYKKGDYNCFKYLKKIADYVREGDLYYYLKYYEKGAKLKHFLCAYECIKNKNYNYNKDILSFKTDRDDLRAELIYKYKCYSINNLKNLEFAYNYYDDIYIKNYFITKIIYNYYYRYNKIYENKIIEWSKLLNKNYIDKKDIDILNKIIKNN